jgi:hypothetical protein
MDSWNGSWNDCESVSGGDERMKRTRTRNDGEVNASEKDCGDDAKTAICNRKPTTQNAKQSNKMCVSVEKVWLRAR